MGWLQDWATVMKLVVRHPKEFFADMDPVDDFDHPVRFAATSYLFIALLGGITRPIVSSLTETTFSFNVMAMVFGMVGTFVRGAVMVFVGAGLIHLFVLLFGSKGYSRTFAVVAYSTAIGVVGAVISVALAALLLPFITTTPGMVAGIILLVGLLLGLGLVGYTLYVQIIGIKEFHDLSRGRAAAAVLLPIVLLIILALLLAAGFFVLLTGSGPTAVPSPSPSIAP
jgi:hypothetical protein